MAAHDEEALRLFEDEGLSYEEIRGRLGLRTTKQVNHALLRARKKQAVEYEDKREYTEDDVEEFIRAMIGLQEKSEKLNTRQTQASVRLNDDKPMGVAYWGDWHIGAAGVDYKLFERDLRKIRDTEGLYFIGAGDYKDNFVTGIAPGAQYEQIIQPGLQDKTVIRYLEQVGEKCLALVRGCFLSGTPITMSDGTTVPIEDVSPGQMVVSGTGQARKVVKKHNNWYSGEVVEFGTVGNIGTVNATADHKVLAIKRSEAMCYHRDRVCKPLSPTYERCRAMRCSGKAYEAKWRELGELGVGDMLLMPKSPLNDSSLTPGKAYLFGLFLADGCYVNTKKQGITITLSAKERGLAEIAKMLFMSEYGMEPSIRERKDRNTVSVSVHRTKIANIFYKKCGNLAHSKVMEESMVTDRHSIYVLAGMLDGDGHQRKDQGRCMTITTISKNLAYQLRRILLNNGIANTLRVQHRENRDYDDYQINIRAAYAGKIPSLNDKANIYEYRKASSWQFEVGGYIATPIRSLTKYQYAGPTYDLEIDQDHSYLANGIIAHNCHEDWDKKLTDVDFMEHLCHVTESVNLWHGGEITVKIGDQSYLWRCRHKYKYQSSLNLENAMRRINEIQGPCDVAAEAHLHNGYIMQRHLMGQYRIMLRTGSYKVMDEFGQKLAGYQGLPTVPVVIMFPDRHLMIGELHLDNAIEILNSLRR